MSFIQPKGKAHILSIRRMAEDIQQAKSITIESSIKEAIDWHRELCQRDELERRIEIQKSNCVHIWRVLCHGEYDVTVYQCELCGETEPVGDD